MGPSRDRRLIVLLVFALIAVGVVAAVLIGRGGDDDGEETTASAGAEGCERVQAPEPREVSLEAPKQ